MYKDIVKKKSEKLVCTRRCKIEKNNVIASWLITSQILNFDVFLKKLLLADSLRYLAKPIKRKKKKKENAFI